VTSFIVSLAQAAAPAGAPAGGGGVFEKFGPLPMMIIIFGVFYLLVIRPQQKKAKLQQQMISELKAGDLIVTQGGIIGKITGVRDPEVVVEVSQGVRIRILRSHILNKHTPGEAAPKAEAKAS
jgi:preprotein translocase subunit YajC